MKTKSIAHALRIGAQTLLRLPLVPVLLTVVLVRPAHAVAQSAVVYNIQQAWEDTFSLTPGYAGDAASLGTSSSLVASGLYRWSQGYPPYPNLTQPGHWVFAGWSHTPTTSPVGVPFMEFSFTATEAVSFGAMDYTFFSGNWSDLWIGPSHLQIWTSTDGFATSSLLTEHDLLVTHPFTGAEPTFHDDLSSISDLLAGETLSVRFVASYGSPPHAEAPAGFLYAVSGSPIQFNIAVQSASAVPEPATSAVLLAGAALGLAGWQRRRRRPPIRA